MKFTNYYVRQISAFFPETNVFIKWAWVQPHPLEFKTTQLMTRSLPESFDMDG